MFDSLSDFDFLSYWRLLFEPQPMNKDLNFEAVYPVSFWSSTTGQILKYTSIATVVGVITYFTIGAGTIAATAALIEAATPGIWALILSILGGDIGGIIAWCSGYFAVQSIIGSSFAVIAGEQLYARSVI